MADRFRAAIAAAFPEAGADADPLITGTKNPALGDFQWDGLASAGKRFGIVPLGAGTVDGRLAGNRDRMPSETTEDYRRALARTS